MFVPLCDGRPLCGCGPLSQAKTTSGGLYQAEQGQDRQGDKPYPLHPVPEEKKPACSKVETESISGVHSCGAQNIQ